MNFYHENIKRQLFMILINFELLKKINQSVNLTTPIKLKLSVNKSSGLHRGGQMQVGHPGHYYMSIDEATASDLQHRQRQQQQQRQPQHARQYSPVPSPPGTPQNIYTYSVSYSQFQIQFSSCT